MPASIKVTIDQLASSVFSDDRLNDDIMMLDLLHVLEITLRIIALAASVSTGVTIEVSDQISLEVTYANPQTKPA